MLRAVVSILLVCAIGSTGASADLNRELTIRVETASGEPLPFGHIRIVPSEESSRQGPGLIRVLIPGHDGSVTASLMAGRYTLHWLSSTDVGLPRIEVDRVKQDVQRRVVRSDSSEHVEVIHVEPPSIEVDLSEGPREVRFIFEDAAVTEVEIKVRSREGEPVEGVSISAFRDGEEICFACAWSDERGEIRLVLGARPFRVVPHDESGLWSFIPEEVDVLQNGEGLEVVAFPLTSTVFEGRLVSQYFGTPVENATIHYQQECDGRRTGGDVTTDSDGRFRTSCLPGCAMQVSVGHRAHPGCRHSRRIADFACTPAEWRLGPNF